MTTIGEDMSSAEGQAIGWIVRLHAGDAAESDWRDLETWLAEHPSHLDAYERVESLWAELDTMAAGIAPRLADDSLPQAQILPFARPERTAAKAGAKRRAARAWAPWAGVAGLAGAAAVAALVLAPAVPTAYATGRGETRHVVLKDGTKVDLNAGSRITVSFDGHARRVQVDDAEASFDVAHDAARPFLIAVGDQQIRVVGTQFNVRRRDAGLTLTVSRGVVEVRPLAGGEAPPVRLTAGDQLARRDGDAASTVSHVAAAEAFAWREHRLICHACTLGTLAGDLNRAFVTPIDVEANARPLTFSGVLVLDNEDAVVGRLAAFLPIKADRTGTRIVLSSTR
ncbi:MAG: FecR domain-containing protein [Proteobacteria bacterium]|nr:FecR domain-containing protein [Pseudomonadota bacterium]